QPYLSPYSEAYLYNRYSLQRTGNIGHLNTSPSRLAVGIIPGSVDQLPKWVVPHLRELFIHLEDARRADLYQRLTAQGIPYPDLILSNHYNRWDKAMRDHPKDLAIPAAWVLHEMAPQSYPREYYEQIYD